MAVPSGILAFEVPELLAPVNRCIVGYQLKIVEEELDTMDVLQKDPVPQYTTLDIKRATEFLTAANRAMKEFSDSFKPLAEKSLSSDQLTTHRDAARESQRRLGLLFSEKEPFSGSRMKGDLVIFAESKQSEEVRRRLTSLSAFLEEFGKAQWLGQMLQTSDFQQNIQLCTKLLSGLLAPKRKCLDTSSVQSRFYKADRTATQAGFSSTSLARFSMVKQRLSAAVNLHQVQPGQQVPARAPAPRNPLQDIEERHQWTGLTPSSDDYVKLLEEMCNELKGVCREDSEKRAKVRAEHNEKMECLRQLAEELNRMPAVLNQYLLVRLGEIDQMDWRVLKAWISEKEADEVHKFLGKFCDAATEENAYRRAAAHMAAAAARAGNAGAACANES